MGTSEGLVASMGTQVILVVTRSGSGVVTMRTLVDTDVLLANSYITGSANRSAMPWHKGIYNT